MACSVPPRLWGRPSAVARGLEWSVLFPSGTSGPLFLAPQPCHCRRDRRGRPSLRVSGTLTLHGDDGPTWISVSSSGAARLDGAGFGLGGTGAPRTRIFGLLGGRGNF